MLAIASAISVPTNSSTPPLPPANQIFQFALHHIHKLTTLTPSRAQPLVQGGKRSHIFLVQAYVLMSLRQTRMGDRASAYLYASMAAGMCLELGLHRRVAWGPASATGKRMSQADDELRSRTWWCCYILDKVLAEETGRPVLLHARRSTTPLPSVTEADEYELWPPPQASSFLFPRAQSQQPKTKSPAGGESSSMNESGSRGNNNTASSAGADANAYPVVEPTQGHIISAFNITCKLACIVEDILDIEVEGPRFERTPVPGEDEEFSHQSIERALSNKDRLADALEAWHRSLPDNLRVDVTVTRPAPPHLVVNLAWYHSAVILLHSRFISLKPQLDSGHSRSQTGLYGACHLLCANSAEAIVALVQNLEKNKLLEQLSSDVIHMLSQAALVSPKVSFAAALPAFCSLQGQRNPLTVSRIQFVFARRWHGKSSKA